MLNFLSLLLLLFIVLFLSFFKLFSLVNEELVTEIVDDEDGNVVSDKFSDADLTISFRINAFLNI